MIWENWICLQKVIWHFENFRLASVKMLNYTTLGHFWHKNTILPLALCSIKKKKRSVNLPTRIQSTLLSLECITFDSLREIFYKKNKYIKKYIKSCRQEPSLEQSQSNYFSSHGNDYDVPQATLMKLAVWLVNPCRMVFCLWLVKMANEAGDSCVSSPGATHLKIKKKKKKKF